mgnify:CR=1 FL=1
MTTAAWYLLKTQAPWAKWFNVIHWPYTLFHLSYVVIGACLAKELNLPLLGWTLLAFFLGMGIGAHCYDLVKGDPLKLGLHPGTLIIVGFLALAGAVGIGLWQVWLDNVSLYLVVASAVGLILATGYGLEWKGLHGNWQFAAWWAGFPLIVSYLAQGLAFTPVLIPVLIFALASATAQRVLSTRARYLRRLVGKAKVELWSLDGDYYLESKDSLLKPLDTTLAWLSLAMVALAGGLLAWRLMM